VQWEQSGRGRRQGRARFDPCLWERVDACVCVAQELGGEVICGVDDEGGERAQDLWFIAHHSCVTQCVDDAAQTDDEGGEDRVDANTACDADTATGGGGGGEGVIIESFGEFRVAGEGETTFFTNCRWRDVAGPETTHGFRCTANSSGGRKQGG